MVALSLSKSLNPAEDVMRTPDRKTAQRFLLGLLERLVKVAAVRCPQLPVDRRIIAISVHAVMVFQNLETRMFETGQLNLTFSTWAPNHDVYRCLARTVGRVAWG